MGIVKRRDDELYLLHHDSDRTGVGKGAASDRGGGTGSPTLVGGDAALRKTAIETHRGGANVGLRATVLSRAAYGRPMAA